MSIRTRAALVAGSVFLATCAGEERRAASGEGSERPAVEDSFPQVVLETSMGTVVMELNRPAAPQTVRNILRHVGVGFYDGLVFHRVERGFIIQTGDMTADFQARTSSAPPVPFEGINNLSHTQYSVGLARMSDPNSGGVQFFINLADNHRALNFRSQTAQGFGYTVFGRVIEGTDVVDRIGRVRTATQRGIPNLPVAAVVVNRAYVRPGTRADSTAAGAPRTT